MKRLVLTIFIIVTSIFFIKGLGILRQTDIKAKHIEEEGKDLKNNDIGNKNNNNNKEIEKPINLLILGLDGDDTRSDTIILFNYKPGKEVINLLSIPRDTKVAVDNMPIKINALVGIGGENLIIEKVEEITGLPINYYVTMGFEGFKKIIDELGGIEFNVPFDMHYDDPAQNLHIHLEEGRQILDGDKALQFVRYRKSNVSGIGYKNGDLGRIGTQQLFIEELVKQKLNPKYIPKINEVFEILKEHMKTNIKLVDIMYYLKDFNFKIDEIKTWIVPGDSTIINGIAYFLHDSEKTIGIIKNNFHK
jgi:LCP family protein required for cell wall assembly